jgi:hypothetical protein
VRRFAWVPFAVALLAFLLPFATVSCGGSRVEASGADLVLRTAPKTESSRAATIDLGELVVAYGGGLATAAFLAFAVGLLGAARGWRGAWASLAGVVGVAALVFLKTRGGGRGPEGIAEVDTRLGGVIAVVAGVAGAGVATAALVREEGRPPLRPLAPVAAAGLLLFGYLFPSDRTPLPSFAYADSLNVRRPWEGAFWLLPVLAGVLFLACREALPRRLAGFSVGVLAVVAVELADKLWGLWQDEDVGLATVAFFAGSVIAGLWAAAAEWRGLRRPAALPLALGVATALAAWVVGPA